MGTRAGEHSVAPWACRVGGDVESFSGCGGGDMG